MIPVNVLVVFYSRYGEAEKLALAAGVGAIRARANIRLRRLTDLASPETIQADPAWSENLDRMKKDYIAPRELDAQWADVLILAAPDDCRTEMERFLEAAAGLLKGKLAAVIGPFHEAAVRAGLSVVSRGDLAEDKDGATAYGRLSAEDARRKKQAES